MADEKSPQLTPQAPAEQAPPAPRPDDRTVIRPADGAGEETTPIRTQYQPPYIVVVDGPRTGARFPLQEEGPNIIGRAPGNAVRLEDQSVSRQHAEIVKGPSGWTLTDLGSKNGSAVNGKPIADAVVIGHKDVIKTGIYYLRLITQPVQLEEEMTLPPELVMADRTVFVAAPPDGLTSEIQRKKVAEGQKTAPREPPPEVRELSEGEGMPARRRSLRKIAIFGSLGLALLLAAGWFAQRTFLRPSGESAEVGEEGTQAEPPSAPPEAFAGPAEPVPPVEPPPAPLPQTIPVFLDFASSPLPASVAFQDRELGSAPLRVNVELEPGKSYAAQATFLMPEIGQRYMQQIDFTVEKDKPVVPLLFRAPIGMIKVMDLPRDVQFYLEGKFSYDRFQEQTAKLNEIVLQKPIYVPYGSYVLELRRARQLGESSPTYVSDIIFHRDFALAEDAPVYQVAVKEEDLKVFPAKVKSDPQNAELFVDGLPVGITPYEGIFPLGEHKLTLRKEGYFEHTEDLKVDINTPYLANIKLKTSVAGAHINNARQAMNRAMFSEAVGELAQALASSPAPSETDLANLLLGTCYLQMSDLARAIAYFELARQSESQRLSAMLGLASVHAFQNRMEMALPLLVEVLLKAADDETKRAANGLFQRISPFRSILYVHSDPPGATVVVNDRPVAEPTPVILHELSLGSYKLHLEKPGYLPTDLNLSLSVNEFNPVIVKLKPIPQ